MIEFFDLLKYLEKTLAVGVELERPVPASCESLGRLFNAPGNRNDADSESGLSQYKEASATDYNVVYVYGDPTVRCSSGRAGAEIVFCGTNEGMRWIYDRLLRIETKLNELGANNYHVSCSNHITLHAIQERIVPAVVFRNYYNLCRLYSSALLWLGSGDHNTLVRNTMHSNAVIDLRLNPADNTLANLFQNTHHHSFCNFESQKIRGGRDGQPQNGLGVYIEMRNVDGIRVPSAIASLMMLYKSLFFKALHLSLNGIIEIEDGQDYAMNQIYTGKMMRGQRRDLIFTEQEKANLINHAKNLIGFVSPQLKMISPDAIKPLFRLAEKPCSFRSGTWAGIDKAIYKEKRDLTENETTLLDNVINQAINKDSATGWKKVMANQLNVSGRMVEHLMSRIEEKTMKRFVFERDYGSYILV